ncbi:WD repeat-containing protein 89 [Bombina bombina]|uniref:WD repeat-containing protein 89 n=1 Tax=Bombina bombina TaxID=8345 RepID=UPI00235A5919|nr:WD repeat-containing protein 89 [Bombina bombina]
MKDLEEQLSLLQIAKRSPMKDNNTYVLDIDAAEPLGGQGDATIAVLCSGKSVQLYNKETLVLLQEYDGHPALLSGVKFAHKNCHLLFSACSDGTVKCWDTRLSGREVAQVFTGYPSNVFISFDVSSNDLVVCAATEKVEEDAFMVFWDARYDDKIKSSSKEPLGVYSESHNDDITQVRFHPTNPSRLASGSTDGLVNIFDISKDNEDDALVATCNSDSSISFLGWAGNEHNEIFCLTHDEGFYWWDLAQMDTDQPITLMKIQDMREAVNGCTIDYVVGGFYHKKVDKLFLVGGTNNGVVHLLNCAADKVMPISLLQEGHSATVRSFYWDVTDDSLLTGGEDAQLLLWKAKAKDSVPKKKETLKMASSLQQRLKIHNTKLYGNKQH